MLTALADFRRHHGRSSGFMVDPACNDWCMAHSQAMADQGTVYHSPKEYRGDWAECVAMSSMVGSWDDTGRRILFDVLGSDQPHRDIILNAGILAWGRVVKHGAMYMTIRAKS